MVGMPQRGLTGLSVLVPKIMKNDLESGRGAAPGRLGGAPVGPGPVLEALEAVLCVHVLKPHVIKNPMY